MSAAPCLAQTQCVDVLIVEDEERLASFVLRALPEMGLTGLCASNVDEAQQILATHDVRVLLLDIRLGKDDGLTMLESLRADNDDRPAVLMTAHADVPSVQRALRCGAADFITKPFTLSQLETALSRAYSKTLSMPIGCTAVDLSASAQSAPNGASLSMDQVRQQALNAALDHAQGNKQRAAEILGVSRRTLYNWLERIES